MTTAAAAQTVAITAMRTDVVAQISPWTSAASETPSAWSLELTLDTSTMSHLIATEIEKLLADRTDPGTGEIWDGYPAAGGASNVVAAAAAAMLTWHLRAVAVFADRKRSGSYEGSYSGTAFEIYAETAEGMQSAVDDLDELLGADLRHATRTAALGASAV